MNRQQLKDKIKEAFTVTERQLQEMQNAGGSQEHITRAVSDLMDKMSQDLADSIDEYVREYTKQKINDLSTYLMTSETSVVKTDQFDSTYMPSFDDLNDST